MMLSASNDPSKTPRLSPLHRQVDALLPTSECVPWPGVIRRDGYGMHRAVYVRHRGEIRHGLHLDHLCRNRSCVNPDHLEPVTPAENARRGILHKYGRYKTGCGWPDVNGKVR